MAHITDTTTDNDPQFEADMARFASTKVDDGNMAPARKLAAAFRLYGGRKELVQPELDEISNPDRDLWLFWIEAIDGTSYVTQEAGGVFMAREQAASEWHKTATLARWIVEATRG